MASLCSFLKWIIEYCVVVTTVNWFIIKNSKVEKKEAYIMHRNSKGVIKEKMGEGYGRLIYWTNNRL